ncbi:MAG: FAD-binding oxidoreductase [Polyangiaceae bacterium]|nr:FAD-binding oxidoreductase [Polyangiaceae bacterium]
MSSPSRRKARLRLAAKVVLGVLMGASLFIGYRLCESGPGFGEDGLTLLTFTCGDTTCDVTFGESPDTCRRDCAESRPRVSGFYSDITRCPQHAEIHVAGDVASVQGAVRTLVRNGKRVKARGQGHSTGLGFCSDGGVVILERLSSLSELERWRGLDTVVIEPGVTFAQLGEHLHARQRSFGPYATGWGGIAVVGAMATGSHGSDTKLPSTISEQLVEVELVDQRGDIVRYNRFDTPADTWRALTAHDGALGIVVRARIEVFPDRKLQLEFQEHELDEFKTDAGIADVFAHCDYAFLNLMLKSNRAHVACGAVTDDPVTDERLTNYLFSPPVHDVELSLVRTAIQWTTVSPWFEGVLERQILGGYQHSVGIEPTHAGGKVTYVGHRGVGWNHRIVNLPRFPYAVPYFSQIDYEVSVRARDMPEIVRIIDDIFDRHQRTLPYTGIIVRFDRATESSFIAGNSVRPGVEKGEALAHIELPTFVPFGYRDEAREAYFKPSDDAVRVILERFHSARLHLGKNRPSLFARFAELDRDGEQRARYQAVVSEMDPYGVFANEHLRQMGLRWPKEGQDFASHYFPETPDYTRTGN